LLVGAAAVAALTWLPGAAFRPVVLLQLGEPGEDKVLVATAASEGETILLREIDGRPYLDGEVMPAKGGIKLFPIQQTGPLGGALVKY
jgi:hypothetical protein